MNRASIPRETRRHHVRHRWRTTVGMSICLGVVGALMVGGGPAVAGGPRSGRTTIVVSPTGNDHHAGTARKPLRTLAAAQVRARAAVRSGAAVTVELRDGTYRLDRPLRFTAADSGTAAKPVTWTAARGAHPVVSGGRTVGGWSRYDAAKNIFVARVRRGADSRQLYRN